MFNTDFQEKQSTLIEIEGDSKVESYSQGGRSEAYTMTQFEVINALYDSKIFSRLKLTAGAKLVLIALARHFNPQKEDFFPSYSCIAEHTGISKKSVERGIKELTESGLISYRTQKVNRYRFTGLFFRLLNLEETVKDGNINEGHLADNLSADERQNVCGDWRQNVAQTNNHEKRSKKAHEDKNFSNFEKTRESEAAEAVQQAGSQGQFAQSGNGFGSEYKVNYCKYSHSKAYSNFRGAKADKLSGFGAQEDGESYYKRRARDFYASESSKSAVAAGDGGGSRVPSAAESAAYIEELRESRKFACAPIDFDPERAERWYKSLNPLLKTSIMAKKVASKFGFDGPKYVEGEASARGAFDRKNRL